MTATAPDSSFAAKAQSLVPALVTAAAIGMVWQMFGMNHAIGALEANTAALIEQGREHSAQLRDLDHRMVSLDTRMAAVENRMAGIEAQLQALTASIGKLVPK
jgi:predicted ABC-type transport system involved in lysophospholipase L1 biosynthesis ATPase subunit